MAEPAHEGDELAKDAIGPGTTVTGAVLVAGQPPLFTMVRVTV